MRTVFHWQIPVDDEVHTVQMPEGARISHVAIGPTTQPGNVSLWAVVDAEDVALEPRSFAMSGTGHPVPDGWEYVGTAPEKEVPLVWHLWEVRT